MFLVVTLWTHVSRSPSPWVRQIGCTPKFPVMLFTLPVPCPGFTCVVWFTLNLTFDSISVVFSQMFFLFQSPLLYRFWGYVFVCWGFHDCLPFSLNYPLNWYQCSSLSHGIHFVLNSAWSGIHCALISFLHVFPWLIFIHLFICNLAAWFYFFVCLLQAAHRLIEFINAIGEFLSYK